MKMYIQPTTQTTLINMDEMMQSSLSVSSGGTDTLGGGEIIGS